jgi:hypothetical protein
VALSIANLTVDRPNELVTRPDAILIGIFPPLTFSTNRIPLYFYDLSCHVVCVSLAVFSRDFGVLCTSLLIP